MNGRATKREGQKSGGGWLWAVVGLLFATSCRAPVPEAGRYQWKIVPTEGGGETICVIDTGTGEMARWNYGTKKWTSGDAMPDSLPDWKALREDRREQVKQREEREKQAKEAREKCDALAKSYAQLPLEKQVAWAKTISVCKIRGRRYVGLRTDSTSVYVDDIERIESLKDDERVWPANMRWRPYKATDDGLVVWFNGMADGGSLEFGLSRTPIDSTRAFPAPATIIDDVKAEIKRQEERQRIDGVDAHGEAVK